VALLVETCPGCGAIGVYWNGRLVARVSLASSTRRLRQVVALVLLPPGGRGTLKIQVLTGGKPVVIDGIGLSAV
jgi:hypothetical protein